MHNKHRNHRKLRDVIKNNEIILKTKKNALLKQTATCQQQIIDYGVELTQKHWLSQKKTLTCHKQCENNVEEMS